MMRAPDHPDKSTRESASIVRQEPGKLSVLANPDRRTMGYVFLFLGIGMLGGWVVLVLWKEHQSPQDWWWMVPIGVFFLSHLAFALYLIQSGKRTVFDLDGRKMTQGKKQAYFDDIVALYVSFSSGRRNRKGKLLPGPGKLGLVLRIAGSQAVLGVQQFIRALESISRDERSSLYEKLPELWEDLSKEKLAIANNKSRAKILRAARHLAEELRIPLLRFDSEPLALLPGELHYPLTQRLARKLIAHSGAGQPPDSVTEEMGPGGRLIRWKRPRKSALVNILLNLIPVLLVVIMTLFRGKDIDLSRLIPFLLVVATAVPFLLFNILSKVSLELSHTTVVFKTRFVFEKVKEMPFQDLIWLQIQASQHDAILLFIGERDSIDLPMPKEVAAWVRNRVLEHLAAA